MNQTPVITTTKLADNVWRFNQSLNPSHSVDAYLLCGSERAMVIDALMVPCGLYEKVRELTSLPIIVVVTHGHGDHAGDLKGFRDAGCPVYFNTVDLAALNGMSRTGYTEADFIDYKEGASFDLGGCTVYAYTLNGHTAGSMVLICPEAGFMFSGDTVGSGQAWIFFPGAPLLVFVEGARALIEKTAKYGSYKIMPGHAYQSPTQLTEQYIKDLCEIAEKVGSGEVEGETMSGGMFTGAKSIAYKSVQALIYNPNNIRS
jgi:glyoxylase-like metal-dependent hydrolase (beta-lactamase superfamily II)